MSNVDKKSADHEHPVRLCNYADVYNNSLISSRISFMAATATNDEIKKFSLKEGDVLITKDSETWTDIGVPAFVEEVAADIVCGYHLALLRPRTACLNGRYLFRWLQSCGAAYQMHVRANGVTRYGLSQEAIKSVRLPIPPLTEQSAIVSHLDEVDQRIGLCIRAKRKRIELLGEKRQALIHQAITGKTKPETSQRCSNCSAKGTEWMGQLPRDWNVRRIKQVAKILRGRFAHRPRNDPSLYGGRYPFIQTGDVARADRAITSYRQTLNNRGVAVSKVFPPGTLVMSISANIGDVAFLDFEACFPDSVVGFLPGSEMTRDYLYYVLHAMQPELVRAAPVNTQGNLNVERIGSQTIPCPAIHEQQEIVRHIEERIGKLDAVAKRELRAISTLKEYQTRLFYDAVTGKIDVRSARMRRVGVSFAEIESSDAPNSGANWGMGEFVPWKSS